MTIEEILIQLLPQKSVYSKADALAYIISEHRANGCLCISERSLAKIWGWSKTSVNSFLKYLVEKGCLVEKKDLERGVISSYTLLYE